MNDKIRDRDRNRPPRDDPYDNLKNIHLDVHGLRRDIREAIKESQAAILNAVEHSQSALMMRLSLIDNKIDKLTPVPGASVDTSKLEAALPAAEAATAELDKDVTSQP